MYMYWYSSTVCNHRTDSLIDSVLVFLWSMCKINCSCVFLMCHIVPTKYALARIWVTWLNIIWWFVLASTSRTALKSRTVGTFRCALYLHDSYMNPWIVVSEKTMTFIVVCSFSLNDMSMFRGLGTTWDHNFYMGMQNGLKVEKDFRFTPFN